MRIKNINSILFLFFFTFTTSILGQSSDYILGKILDSLTNEPISFSTIILKQNNLGLYASEEGDFKIKFNSLFLSDTLMISSIGYDKKTIKLNKLDAQNINYIYLNSTVEQLKEVKLPNSRERKILSKSENSINLIQKAIQNITKKYPTKSFNYVSYYRDYQKTNNEYINLNEAIIQTIDNGFNIDNTLNKFRLLDYKINLNFLRTDMALLYDTINAPNYEKPNKFIPNGTLSNQGGNEFLILTAHDPIRNFQTNSFSFIYIFSKDFLTNHTFSNIEQLYNDDLLLFKIKFNLKEELGSGLVTAFGEIFIQPDDYSIHKIEYTCLNKKSGKDIFNVKLEYGYNINESINSLMQLKYISFNNLFNIVDESDNNYFKILDEKINDSYLYDSYLELKMSNLVNEKTVDDKKLYSISANNKKVRVKNIVVKDSTIFVYFKNKTQDKITYKIKSSHFQDLNGNVLNQKKKLEFYQYRELFVQEHNPKIEFKNDCFLQNLPLINNCISKQVKDHKYWMNTPNSIKNEIE